MDVVQLNFAYNTKKLQFKQSKFLGSYQETYTYVPAAFFIISLKLILKSLPLHRFLHLKRLMAVIDE